MNTVSCVRRIVDAMRVQPQAPAPPLPARALDALVVAGIIVGIALAAGALLWRRHTERS